jgi:hypothetical protein
MQGRKVRFWDLYETVNRKNPGPKIHVFNIKINMTLNCFFQFFFEAGGAGVFSWQVGWRRRRLPQPFPRDNLARFSKWLRIAAGAKLTS